MSYLDKIIAHKKEELIEVKKKFPSSYWEEKPFFARKCRSMREALTISSTGIISEFKRKSPSKGFIKEGADPLIIVPGYEKSGATGVSILQDRQFFAGGFEDMICVRPLVHLPLLYKEFVIDEYQLAMAKGCGADIVLLIASVLSEKRCAELARSAREYGLEVLLELHENEEIRHINDDIDVVGINNRNLKTFNVDLEASIRLAHEIPDYFVKISESGISSPETVVRLRKEGFRGFLMGENFMKTDDPAEKLAEFIAQVKEIESKGE